mmetsp:Transcript_131085/g.379241  ORF Transcript_131085/g.379241 Transcript_131085/m.379241 type:complete len:279 (-) Transcript_131085:1977-2813(-)
MQPVGFWPRLQLRGARGEAAIGVRQEPHTTHDVPDAEGHANPSLLGRGALLRPPGGVDAAVDGRRDEAVQAFAGCLEGSGERPLALDVGVERDLGDSPVPRDGVVRDQPPLVRLRRELLVFGEQLQCGPPSGGHRLRCPERPYGLPAPRCAPALQADHRRRRIASHRLRRLVDADALQGLRGVEVVSYPLGLRRASRRWACGDPRGQVGVVAIESAMRRAQGLLGARDGLAENLVLARGLLEEGHLLNPPRGRRARHIDHAPSLPRRQQLDGQVLEAP